MQRKRPGGGGAGGGAASGAAAAAQKAGRLLQGLPSGGVVVAPPAQRTAATVAGVYGVLAAWTLAQGLLEPTPAAAAADVPGAQLALATAATVYLLRDQKRVGLGKAAALALGGLVLGTFLGAGVQSWLRVDIIPLWVRRAHLLTGQPTRAAGVHLHQGLACAYLCLLLRERCECSPSC